MFILWTRGGTALHLSEDRKGWTEQSAAEYAADMEVPLSQETESSIRRLAEDAGRDAGQFAAELLQRFTEQDQSFRRSVERGLGQADRGEMLDEEQMDARIATWFAG